MRRPMLLISVAAVLGSLALPTTALAGVNAWTTGAQSGGTPYRAVLAGDVGMVVVDLSVFRTTDAGATWVRLDGFGNRQARAVAIDTGPGQPWYAATAEGMLRSLDHGATWSEIAGAGDGRGSAYTAVAVDRGRAGSAYFVRSSGGVFRAVDGGAGFWTDVSAGLGTYKNLDGVVVDPFTHAAWGWRYGGGVFTLADGATTWTAVTTAIPSNDAIGVTIDPVSGRVIVGTTAGPAWLSGSSTTWTPVTGGLASPYALSITTDGAGATFMATIDQKVWRLASGATTWTRTSGWSPAGVTPNLVADATTGGHALALASNYSLWPANGAGPVWRTTDSGLSWSTATGIAAPQASGVSASPTVRGLVLASTTSDGVLRSTDGGATWAPAGSGVIPGGRVTAVAFDPTNAGVAFAAVQSGMYRSIDGGLTWAAYGAGSPSANAIVFDPHASGTIWALGGGLSRSTDGGLTWGSPGFNGINQQPFFPSAAAADPGRAGGLYVGGRGGVYHLDPQATSWTTVGAGLGSLTVTGIAIDPVTPANIVVTVWNGGVYRSTDAGAHWAPAAPGVSDPFVSAVAFDAAGAAYASSDAGVLRSTDGGATWAPVLGGLAVLPATRFAFDADGHTIYAATAGMGVVARTRGVAPVATTPALTGKAKVGTALAVGVTSSAFPTPTIAVTWQRCDAKGARCKAIAGARGATYKLTKADRGKRVRATVTTTNALGRASATSASSGVVR